jgi:hypothetical protein
MNNKILYKRYIAEKNYHESKMIIWKIDKLKKYIENNKSRFETTIINMQEINKLLEFEEINDKKLFSLIIKKTEFNNKHIGYTFFFMREQQKFMENCFIL